MCCECLLKGTVELQLCHSHRVYQYTAELSAYA